MKRFILLAFLVIDLVAIGQNPCDDLHIISVQYDAFTDSLIVVSVENNSSELFDYPGFVLINSAGDTVAKELVNYFGIGSESIHLLEVRPTVHNPLQDFTGSLELFTGFYDTQACTWQLDRSLCASEPCDSLIITFQNWGGALVIGDFAWSVTDGDGIVVESGTFTMEAEGQYWQHGLCLVPDTYGYSLTALGEPSGGGPVMTATTSSFFASPSVMEYFEWFNQLSTTLEIPFYTFCAGLPSGIETVHSSENLEFQRSGSSVNVISSDIIKELELFGMDGKLIHSQAVNTQQVLLPANLLTGFYVVKVSTAEAVLTSKIHLQ